MAEELLERVRREIRERKQAAQAAVEESRRLERALAALGPERRVDAGAGASAPRRRRRSSPRRRRAAPGANQAAILGLVRERPGVSAGEIAQATGIPRSTVAPTLSRLTGAGAIERSELPGGGVGFAIGRKPAADAPGSTDDAGAGSPAIEPARRSR